jgi:hypothetical protein
MTISKKLLAVAAAAALTVATAVPALALENEFHGSLRAQFSETNFMNGNVGGFGLRSKATETSGFLGEQRFNLFYTAKANDDLKLVFGVEADTRYGGLNEPIYKGGVNTGNGSANGRDSGVFDADSASLEIKHIYLDFNVPSTGVNLRVGIQPWVDGVQRLFTAADMTGVYATKKFDPLTLKLGWFRFIDNDVNSTVTTGLAVGPGATFGLTHNFTGLNFIGKQTADLITFEGQFAVSKDISVGAAYHNVQRDTATGLFIDSPDRGFELLHMVTLNAAAKLGPAAINPFFAYQFGDAKPGSKIGAFLAGVTSKTNIGFGNINFDAFYMSGDDNGTGDSKDYKIMNGPQTFFTPNNGYFLFRNRNMGNGNNTIDGTDTAHQGRGAIYASVGYDGAMGKLIYCASLGYMGTAEQRVKAAATKESSSLGTEIAAQVGYKMYDNLTAYTNLAYVMLGDGLKSTDANKRVGTFGAADAANPYLVGVSLAYIF